MFFQAVMVKILLILCESECLTDKYKKIILAIQPNFKEICGV